jgi:hypothetical protein
MESCMSWVEEDEGAEDGASDAEAEADSAIAQAMGPGNPTQRSSNKRKRGEWRYSNQDCHSPVGTGIDASSRFGS